MQVNTGKNILSLAVAGVMAAVICVLGPLSVSVGAIPFSLATLAMYFSLYVAGWRLGTLSVLVYVCVGMAGMPVFAGYSGGFAQLLGPTGGYIIGYVPMALIAGAAIDHSARRSVQIAGMIAGTAVLYAFGTAWYCIQAHVALPAALAGCVLPFIPGDLLKMAAAMSFGPVVRGRLVQVGLLKSEGSMK